MSKIPQDQKQKIKEFLLEEAKTIDYYDFTLLLDEFKPLIYEVGNKRRNEQFKKEREKRNKIKENKNLRGEKFEKIVEVGMVVQCEGTKDGKGYREVLKLIPSGIEARKLNLIKITKLGEVIDKYFERDLYITTHGWDKIKQVLTLRIED